MGDSCTIKVIETIEKMVAEVLDDNVNEYKFSFEEIANAAGMEKDKIDFSKVSIYSMYEMVTVSDEDGSKNYNIFKEATSDQTKAIIKFTINPEIRDLYSKIVEAKRE